jgi:hypothetical protein
MKVLDRRVLHWLESIQQKSNLTQGSPADRLLQDLRYTYDQIMTTFPLLSTATT